MAWERNTPTAEGWYWRRKTGIPTHMVWLFPYCGKLCIEYCQYTIDTIDPAAWQGEWYGPLLAPV